jgi:lipopolysaccharide/colanic/teichoic acid biosynthesis glycosyltransferase
VHARSVKRAFDVAASVAGLIATSPLLMAGALAVRATLGRPAFFRQERLGLHGRTFRVVKFRTMSDARDKDGNLLPDEARLNRVGRFVRSSSLDEIPQLWNVLRGEMSLVGPRPLLVQYLARYNSEQARRHSVRPGITGWTQITGRNANSWDEKFALDLWYLDHWSLWLDAKILALTALRVLQRQGIVHEGHATMPEFMGNSAPTAG